MQAIAESQGLSDPPDVTPIRAVAPSEVDALVVDCLHEFGFSAEVDTVGGWGFEYAQEQEEDATRAEYICMGRYPLAEQYVAALTEAQLRIYYDWQIEEVLPCVANLGYPIPTPPSWETYLAPRADGSNSNPFFFDAGLDPATIGADLREIMSKCEYIPPSDLLYQ